MFTLSIEGPLPLSSELSFRRGAESAFRFSKWHRLQSAPPANQPSLIRRSMVAPSHLSQQIHLPCKNCHSWITLANSLGWHRLKPMPQNSHFTSVTNPIFSNALKYSTTISTGTDPYSADTASRISCAFLFPSAKFKTSYAYSSPPPHNPS
jgi:hypothetical protein